MSSSAEATSGDRPAGTLFPVVPSLPADGVLLHVGVHKTGTTAIQAALADARPDLKKLGVLYPGKRKAQHRSALAVTQRTWGWKDRGGESYDMSHYTWLVEQTRKHRGRVAISSEFFCESDAAVARQIGGDLGLDRVHVVVTLRNLGKLLPSSWQQYLKYGLVANYEKWLHNMLDPDAPGSMTPSFWRRNDHASVVSRWVDALGPERVTVVVLEDVDMSAMYRSFAQLLAVPEDLLVSRMNLTSNRSMTAAEAQFLIGLNRRVKTDLTWDEYVRFVRRGVALGIVEGREPAPDEPRLHTPDWALDAAAERGAASVPGIRATGARILGDLDALGARVGSPPPPPDSVNVELPTAAAVQAVVTVIEETRANPELSVRDLRDELWSRTKQDLKLRWRLKSLRP
jgi:hypothetical protein